jgi:hypothetical protein
MMAGAASVARSADAHTRCRAEAGERRIAAVTQNATARTTVPENAT